MVFLVILYLLGGVGSVFVVGVHDGAVEGVDVIDSVAVNHVEGVDVFVVVMLLHADVLL